MDCYFISYCFVVFIASFELFGFEGGEDFAPAAVGFEYLPREDGQELGLAIAERIVTAHGGRIKVESREGKGTSVYVTLPAERIF